MRIAYVCADPGVPIHDWRKGCSIHVQEMIRAFVGLGHELHIFATNPGTAPMGDLTAVPMHNLPPPPSDSSRMQREHIALIGNRALSHALRTAGPFDLVYERYSLWSFAGMRFAKQSNIPGILEVNAPLIDEQRRYRELIDQRSAEQVAARCFRDAHIVAAVSREVANYVRAFPGTRGKIEVLPNAVNPSRFVNNRSNRQSFVRPFTVGFVGSLKPWHGVEILVDAFESVHRSFRHSRLLIVGDGPERDRIESRIRSKGLEAATLLKGAVKPSEIPSLLGCMDVAVAPYPASDNFYFSPLKVYEYMAAGLPVVASAIGQIAELITDEVHGLLCPPGNRAALTQALLCLRHDAALRRRLGSAAREKILQQHTWKRVAEQVIAASKSDTAIDTIPNEALNRGAR